MDAAEAMTTATRKYQMTRVRAGSYLLPSNDAQTLWHVYSFEDGISHGVDHPDRTYWACARFLGTYEQAVFAASADVENYGYITRDGWQETDTYLRTRKDATDAALRNTP